MPRLRPPRPRRLRHQRRPPRPAPTAAPEPTAAPAADAELTVFAAASLTDAFKEIGELFGAANGGATVTFNFAGSDQLATQIG